MTDFDLTNPDKLPFGEWPREAQEAAVISTLLDGYSCAIWYEDGSYWASSKMGAEDDEIYRLKPQSHELQIPDEVWKFFDKAQWAAMDSSRDVWVYPQKPTVYDELDLWHGKSGTSVLHRTVSSITIPTDGIDWRKSLTKRPEGV